VSVKKLKCFFGLDNRVTNQQPTKPTTKMTYPINPIMPTALAGVFVLNYAPPPPVPLLIEFTLNRNTPFKKTEIDDIMNAFHHLIYRPDRKFISQFDGKRKLNIRILKNFHYSDDDEERCEKTTQHINVKFIPDEDKMEMTEILASPTHHVYFTRNHKMITCMSKMENMSYKF
jgi:hypothetical protein